MTAVAEQPPKVAPARPPGSFVLSDVSWDGYVKILDEVGDRAVRMTYDDGLLEFELPSELHELLTAIVGAMVAAALDAAGIDYQPVGSTTWRRERGRAGIEADNCFYIANLPAILARDHVDLDRDPPPDLAVETEVSSPMVDKARVYAALGVPELWRVREDGDVRFFRLTAGGTYEPLTQSAMVPRVDAAIVTQHARMIRPLGSLAHSQVLRVFREALAARP